MTQKNNGTDSKLQLHFAHANGFPAGSYNKIFKLLENKYRVAAIEKVGHNPAYPLDENWHNIESELIYYLKINFSEPVVGVGHSMGGVITMMAAYHRPELFRAIIIMDPPVMIGMGSLVFYLFKKIKLVDRMPPASLSKRRQREWSSREEAQAYLNDKPLFKRFDPDCLHDYVWSATEASDNGVQLSYEVEKEVELFRTTPHDLEKFRKPIKVPGVFICGRDSDVTRSGYICKLARRFKMKEIWVDGGHMFPLENPVKTASLLDEVISELI